MCFPREHLEDAGDELLDLREHKEEKRNARSKPWDLLMRACLSRITCSMDVRAYVGSLQLPH